MNRSKCLLACAALIALATLAACGTPTPQVIAQVDRVATRVAEDLAVAATLTALAPAPAAPTAATLTRPPLTVAASPSPTRLQVTVVPLPTATRLQVTVIPIPTPPVRPAPTALKVAVLPVDGSDGNPNLHNGRNVMAGRNVLLPGFSQGDVKSTMIFGDSVVFQVEVFDETMGKRDGDGIASVTFTISDESGKVVHTRTETTAGYCVFGGGEPECTVWQFSRQGYRWPGGATLRYGVHDAQITIKPQKGAAMNWFWSFRIEKQ